MGETWHIEIPRLAVYLLLLCIPALIFYILRLSLIRPMVKSILRMLLQLTLVGLYMGYIFRYDSLWLNLLWMGIMVTAANISIMHQSGLRVRKMSPYTFPAFFLSSGLILLSIAIVIQPSVLFTARYMIPLLGMIMGNILKSNIIGLERFYSDVREHEHEVMHSLTLGATRFEALRPFIANSCSAAVKPFIGTVATMGLVSLPGMMTGQILGGTMPKEAVAYQIMIMTAILVTSVLSVFTSIMFSALGAFDERDRLKPGIFSGS